MKSIEVDDKVGLELIMVRKNYIDKVKDFWPEASVTRKYKFFNALLHLRPTQVSRKKF